MIAETIANNAGNVAAKGFEAYANIKTEETKAHASVAGKTLDAFTSTVNKAADSFQITQGDIAILKAYTDALHIWQETVKDSDDMTTEQKCEEFEKIFTKVQEQEDRAEQSKMNKIDAILKGICRVACGLGVAAVGIGASIYFIRKPLSVVRVPGFLLSSSGKILKNFIC